ncbi:hypothetical protein Bca52824_024395 [Brassica carinata]|uniref:Uncharacterized protein n=1 Tax=Brassica carinata TaxID=52824 RepID=A0A8X7VKJ1_BRACI|nr:hypothetical protein Bca52824_024395 [Brassica carinata]
MSAGFESKALISSLINIFSCPISSSPCSNSGLANALHFCSNKQRLVLEIPSLSMRLRPKRYPLFHHFFHTFTRSETESKTHALFSCLRTCSGVEVFGGFHIKQQKFSFFIVR